MEILKNPNFDFLGKAKYFIALSIALILAGVGLDARPGHLRYGVEFSGGTQLILHFQSPPEIDKIRDAVTKVSPGAVIQTYGDAKTNKVLVRIAQEAPESDLDAPARAVREALADSYGQNPILESSSEIVGPIVGAELRQKAILPHRPRPALPAHLHRGPLQGRHLGRGRDHRRLPRRPHRPRLPRRLQLRDHPQRHRRAADPRRLQRQRHDRHLRPRAREPRPPPQGPAARRSSTTRSTRPSPARSSRTARPSSPCSASSSSAARCSAASASRWWSASSSGPTRRSSSPCRS